MNLVQLMKLTFLYIAHILQLQPKHPLLMAETSTKQRDGYRTKVPENDTLML
jgi:hypothetical protein